MAYPSDLTDKQWKLIAALTERPDPRGALRKHSTRDILNAIFYVNKTGCQWRFLPKDFAPWKTVYDHYRRLRLRGVWEEMLYLLNEQVRQKKTEPQRPAISSSTPKASRPMPKVRAGDSTAAKRSKGVAARSR